MAVYHHFDLNSACVSALKSESATQRVRADLVGSEKCSLEFGMAVNDRGKCYVSGPGTALNAYHQHVGKEQARMFGKLDAELMPTRASYIYYEEDHYSFLHHDAASAHITLITGLSKELTPLLLFPNFGRATQADIDLLNQIPNLRLDEFSEKMIKVFAERGVSIQVPVNYGQTLALAGRTIAHARPAQKHHGAVATACYSFIQPPTHFLL